MLLCNTGLCARCCWVMTEIKIFLIWLNTQYYNVEFSEPNSFFSFIFIGKTCLYTLRFLIQNIMPLMLLCVFFSKPPWVWKILLLYMLMGSSVNRDTDHDFKSIFMGIKMLLELSAILKWMTLAVFPDCYWLARLLHYQHQKLQKQN